MLKKGLCVIGMVLCVANTKGKLTWQQKEGKAEWSEQKKFALERYGRRWC